jgi:hypothetical protein
MPASSLTYEIVRQPPPENGENQYRIKCKSETFERIARESELKRRALSANPMPVVRAGDVR